jgi:hypothetical protein
MSAGGQGAADMSQEMHEMHIGRMPHGARMVLRCFGHHMGGDRGPYWSVDNASDRTMGSTGITFDRGGAAGSMMACQRGCDARRCGCAPCPKHRRRGAAGLSTASRSPSPFMLPPAACDADCVCLAQRFSPRSAHAVDGLGGMPKDDSYRRYRLHAGARGRDACIEWCRLACGTQLGCVNEGQATRAWCGTGQIRVQDLTRTRTSQHRWRRGARRV